jgi:hypothetical protein
MATTKMKQRPSKAQPDVCVVVMAMGTLDDVPVRVFRSTTPRSDARQWAEQLAKSADAVDETVTTLCHRMGWNKHAHGVSRLRLVCFERGIPTEILADIEVINKPATPNRVASYSDI